MFSWYIIRLVQSRSDDHAKMQKINKYNLLSVLFLSLKVSWSQLLQSEVFQTNKMFEDVTISFEKVKFKRIYNEIRVVVPYAISKKIFDIIITSIF